MTTTMDRKSIGIKEETETAFVDFMAGLLGNVISITMTGRELDELKDVEPAASTNGTEVVESVPAVAETISMEGIKMKEVKVSKKEMKKEGKKFHKAMKEYAKTTGDKDIKSGVKWFKKWADKHPKAFNRLIKNNITGEEVITPAEMADTFD